MFYDKFNKLCEKKNISANKACIDMNISRTSAVKWRNGAIPNGKTLDKISKYFEVPIDYLLENNQNKETLENSKSFERLIKQREIIKILDQLPDNLLETGLQLIKSLENLKDQSNTQGKN